MNTSDRARLYATVLLLLLGGRCLLAQDFDVTARLRLIPSRPATAGHEADAMGPMTPGAVIWLTPLDENIRDRKPPMPPGTYTLIQKNKQFSPHLLVVPVGSMVMFPNQDTFFHNVFSMFNGRRFDLGLYEAGSTRGVRFSREGVSYIFCNIHPEMSAVVLALSTPYFAIAGPNGALLHDVPAGHYRLHVWSERAEPERLEALTRVVRITANNTSLGTIDIPQSAGLNAGHKNKFGKDYDTAVEPLY